MINFKCFTLDNGLRVVVHEDPSSAIAAVNIMYNVGSRNEAPNKTGFAHLFEHLMFGGSKNIPVYDRPLQQVGGENNAYTTPDLTNYYCTLPTANLETAFWLESDRMLGLSFAPAVLAVQKKVVIEEFKEGYLNQPYGDVWLKLCDLAYTQHPYRWPTIGKEIAHIKAATMEEVKAFFYQFYLPNNAVLVVAGGVRYNEVQKLSEKWFGPIPAGPACQTILPQEPTQTSPRSLHITANVPHNALYKAYHIPGRLSPNYHTVELMTELLGGSKSSRLYEELVDTNRYFNSIEAYTTGSTDPGLCILSGTLNEGVTFEVAEGAMEEIITKIQREKMLPQELEKLKNQAEAHRTFEAVGLCHRAEILAEATLLGDTNLVNREAEEIGRVTAEATMHAAQRILRLDNCSTIYYHRKG